MIVIDQIKQYSSAKEDKGAGTQTNTATALSFQGVWKFSNDSNSQKKHPVKAILPKGIH